MSFTTQRSINLTGSWPEMQTHGLHPSFTESEPAFQQHPGASRVQVQEALVYAALLFQISAELN